MSGMSIIMPSSSIAYEPFLTYELKQNFCTGAASARLARDGVRAVDLATALGSSLPLPPSPTISLHLPHHATLT